MKKFKEITIKIIKTVVVLLPIIIICILIWIGTYLPTEW